MNHEHEMMMRPTAPSQEPDLSAVLNVRRNATASELKEAYRRLSLDIHPDKHHAGSRGVKDAATATWRRVDQAYSILRDPLQASLNPNPKPEH